MKERLQGLVAGIAIGAMCTTGAVFAKTAIETIEVSYDDIKVYKDNVLCELRDANGSIIEPFIYNGTTYMPVRGTANLADMQVTWNGASKSVYLWDTMVPDGTYLMEVCPPYDYDACETFLQSEGQSFSMGGQKYSNGFQMFDPSSNPMIYFNLNSKYSNIDFTIGHVDSEGDQDADVNFFVDGRLVQTYHVTGGELPKTVSVPVSYGLQLKIVVENADDDWNSSDIGFGNVTVR